MMTETHKDLVDRMIVLENLMDTLENDLKTVHAVPFKIPEVYQALIQEILEMTWQDIVKLKKVFREENIKILSKREDNGFTQYQYLVNGYESVFRYWSYAMDMKVLKAMEGYMARLKNASIKPNESPFLSKRHDKD